MQIQKERISKFCELVNQGIAAWVEAGVLLNDILADSPNAMRDIVQQNPMLTRDVLESFVAIGKKHIYPMLVLDKSPGAIALTALPYDTQVTAYHSRVSVLVKTCDGFAERKMKVSELNAAQTRQVFDLDKMRSLSEQRALLQKTESARRVSGSIDTGRNSYSGPDDAAARRDAFEKLATAGPKELLMDALATAQASLLDARRHLEKLDRDSGLDNSITGMLTIIGTVRHHVNEGKMKGLRNMKVVKTLVPHE